MNLAQLREPFAANEIEWRVGQAGMKGTGIWAKVLAYVTNRAIMDRLDAVCGPDNWRNEFKYGEGGAILCGISIRVTNSSVANEWVTKWDGAEATDIEAVKGGLSNAMKRSAVQWGIGRYLYDLEEGWAVVSENGQHFAPKNDKKNIPAFRWDPPKLPSWALPTSDEKPQPPTTRAKPVTQAPVLAADHIVKGKRLGDYDSAELDAMAKALKAEGKDKHKQLLADITTVRTDRLLGPKKVKPDPTDDDARGKSVLAASAAAGPGDGLPF